MTLSASQISLKMPVVTAALLLATAGIFAQQNATPQNADASKTKHPAGVTYEPIRAKSANPDSTNSTTAQPSPTSAETTKRKDGAIVHADYDKRQEGGPLKGIGTAGHAAGDTTADKGIGSAGIPGKAASVQDKTTGVRLKGCPKCPQPMPVRSRRSKARRPSSSSHSAAEVSSALAARASSV